MIYNEAIYSFNEEDKESFKESIESSNEELIEYIDPPAPSDKTSFWRDIFERKNTSI